MKRALRRCTALLTSLALLSSAMLHGAPAWAQAAPNTAPQGDVQMPVLERFVPAPYPEEASKAGLEAAVVLALDIDATGKVVKVSVVEAAGHGFDEAATEAASKFVFKPALRDGAPVAVKILYRYSFVLQPQEAPATEEGAAGAPGGATNAPAGQQGSSTTSGPSAPVGAGVLDGVVTVEGTDVPIEGARVQVNSPNGHVAEIRTEADGHWRIAPIAAGKYTVSVLADGYDLFSAEEEVVNSVETAVVYRLTPVSHEGLEVVVYGVRPNREVTRRVLKRRELARIPGTFGDALRAVQNMPGVGRPPSLSGMLIVRGTGNNTTQVFVDSVFVPNIYHFGGLSSVIPTEMLDSIDFHPGNFSVRYGRATGGIVDARLREGRNDQKLHGLVQLDLIDARMMLEGPAPLLKNWNFMVGARRSHVDAWIVPLLENEQTSIKAAPVYYDYQAFLETRPRPEDYFRVGIFGADDRFSLFNDGGGESGALESANAFWYVNALYKKRLDADWTWDSRAAFGHYHQRFALSSIFADSTAQPFLLRSELSYRISPAATFHFGPDILFAPFQVDLSVPRDGSRGIGGGGSFVTAPPLVVSDSGLYFRPAIYAEMEMTPSKRSKVVSGVRVDYTLATERFDVAPRLTGRYDVAAGYPRTTLKSGVGLFYQPPEIEQTLPGIGNTGLRSSRALHLSAGIEQELSPNVEASLEPFVKLLDDWVSRGPTPEGNLAYNNLGTGSVVGAEMLLRYKADARFFGWLSYTLSRSMRTWGPGQEAQLFEFDQTHVLTAVASYQLGAGWELGGRFRLVSGNPYTPCTSGIFDASAGGYNCVSGLFGSRRLPPFHQLDVRVDKRWQFSGWSLGAYLDLVNAYNRVNPDEIAYNFDYTESRPETASLPILPSVGVRGEF